MSHNPDEEKQKLIDYAVNTFLYGKSQVLEQHFRHRSFREDLADISYYFALLDFKYSERSILYNYVNKHIIHEASIDYLEFGVAAGASIMDWLLINKCTNSRFFGFDSFEGLPENWHENAPKGTFSTNGKIPDINDERVQFIKGYFQDTVDRFSIHFIPRNRLVLHLDADLYSSTLYVLMNLNRHIKPGTVLIFDEFDARSFTDEYAALKDYCKACLKKYKILAARKDFVKLALEIM